MNINQEFKKLSIKLKKEREDKFCEFSLFLDLRINMLQHKQSKEELSDKQIVEQILKFRGYSKFGNIYTKEFVLIEINTGDNLSEVKIKHDIPQIKTGALVIKKSFVTGLHIALRYFERI